MCVREGGVPSLSSLSERSLDQGVGQRRQFWLQVLTEPTESIFCQPWSEILSRSVLCWHCLLAF